ncbi:MAG: hypothetical protein E6Q97_03960 [Desulfurellales bacterium]|nr:MAG: hypothetical protein E6Q97_03960 [Desulfurellales bacterium]
MEVKYRNPSNPFKKIKRSELLAGRLYVNASAFERMGRDLTRTYILLCVYDVSAPDWRTLVKIDDGLHYHTLTDDDNDKYYYEVDGVFETYGLKGST